jgi:hypothetical protein
VGFTVNKKLFWLSLMFCYPVDPVNRISVPIPWTESLHWPQIQRGGRWNSHVLYNLWLAPAKSRDIAPKLKIENFCVLHVISASRWCCRTKIDASFVNPYICDLIVSHFGSWGPGNCSNGSGTQESYWDIFIESPGYKEVKSKEVHQSS